MTGNLVVVRVGVNNLFKHGNVIGEYIMARRRNRRHSRLRPVPQQCKTLIPVGTSIMTGYTIYQTSSNPGGSYVHVDDATGYTQV